MSKKRLGIIGIILAVAAVAAVFYAEQVLQPVYAVKVFVKSRRSVPRYGSINCCPANGSFPSSACIK